MPILYVTRVYEVRVPEIGTPERDAIEFSIFKDNAAEDAMIITDDNKATALYMAYKFEVGNFTEYVEYYDSYVKDVMPDQTEFTADDFNSPKE